MTQQYRPVQSKMKIQAGEATVVADTTSPLTEHVLHHLTLMLGTSVQVNVKEWTQESEAVGKMHIVWVKITGIPDEMKSYQALNEIGSNLGPVMEVDIATLRASNVIKVKVGMMELDPLPLKLVLAFPKGLLFQAHFELVEVAEQVVNQAQRFLRGGLLMPDMMVVEDKIKCSQILRDKELAFKLQSEDSTMIQLNVCESKKSSSEEGEVLGQVDKIQSSQEQLFGGGQINDQIDSMSRKVAERSQELEMDEEDKEKVSLKDSEDYMDSQESEGSFGQEIRYRLD
ncbi:hypothetical protein OsI_15829 [Oryza sativa Indica Group]|uniref:Uncharacterized protein n=1 Tax=Oryza sativa subsp. indica TaxID=39946 RepID=B8ATN9_ORYSI|nr:hypothetical protein OsI_15829 [Oryza sativa Indica Group]